VYQLFLLNLAVMALWQGSALVVSLTRDAQTALTWYTIMSALVLGQFTVYFAFVRAFLRIKGRRGVLSSGIIVWALSSILVAVNRPQIIADVYWNDFTHFFMPIFGPLAMIVGIPNYCFLMYTVATLCRGYREARSAIERSRIQYLLLGLTVVVLGTLANFAPPSKAYPMDLMANVTNAVLIAYAIFRYPLLDIIGVIRKGLLYSIPTAIIGAGYFLVISVAMRLFQGFAGPQILVLSVLVAIISGGAAQPLRDRAQLWIDRLFFREKHDCWLMLQRLSRTATSVLDPDRLTNMILDEVTTTIHIERAAFFLRQEGSREFRLVAQRGLEQNPGLRLRRDHPVVDWLSSHEHALTRHDVEVMPQFRSLWGQGSEDLERMGAELIIPLRAKGELVGVLAVGPKLSEEAYSQDDQLTLTTLANQTAIAIENARLYDAAQRDLAERKQVEAQVRASLREKEVLLREIHHRVKNNLQVISSLLRLQSQQVEGKQYAEMLRESQNRIRSMALIHEALHRSQNLADIAFRDYIEHLANDLFRSYGVSASRIRLNIEAESLLLGIDRAIPCGLIVNELLSNAIKHAFPEGRQGEITICFHSVNERELELAISDDGIGIPKDVSFGYGGSLGLYLVKILAEDQLHGEMELDRSKGTAFRITFEAPGRRQAQGADPRV